MISVLLAGYGVMGQSLHKCWQETQPSYEVSVVDPSYHGHFPDIMSLPPDYQPHVVVFALKPQILASILPCYKKFSHQGCLFLTIAAGVTLDTYHRLLGQEEMVVRAMPNIAISAGQGMTVLATRCALTANQQSLAENIFKNTGQVAWVGHENLLDTATGVSGSGPAYFFLLAEALGNAAMAEGLNREAALQFARQTAIGAGAMLELLPESSPAELCKRVTSPGGTTEAALKKLDQDNVFQDLVLAAVRAAAARAGELS